MSDRRHPHNKLTDLIVRQALPGRHADGNGLYLYVRESGSRSWVQRLVIRLLRVDMGLGGFPLVSLAEARQLAFDNRRVARGGGDPRTDGKEKTTPIVRLAVETVVQARRANWRDATTETKWRRMFGRFVFPVIGETPIGRVTLDEIRGILVPIWKGRGSLGYVLRQHLDHVFKWAVAHGYRSDNPADKLRTLLPKVKNIVKHHPSLPYQQVAEAVAAVRASDADPAVKLLVVFIVLCASRSGEAAGALWPEIDRKKRLWTLPPERMKALNEHRVPLSVQALEVLDQARALNRSKSFVFPTSQGRRVAPASTSRFLHSFGFVDDKGRPIVLHGFRSTFRVWAVEQAKAHFEICEAALAHVQPDLTVQAYARSDYLEDRRELAQKWADYVLPRSSSGDGAR